MTTADARTIVTTRSVDVLDRVTAVSYSGGTPGTSYAYDTGPFGKGRLSSITQAGYTIQYGYDRARYFPDRIQVPGLLDWDYTFDAVGNPLQIGDLLTSQNRTYGYLDNQYFLATP
ncbi:MAG TPA: hypothetical protein VN493_03275 [Thermoanaerobaculia bacterium]|nr:hypothetical protein [Thermoanaerobaculia bacterium]